MRVNTDRRIYMCTLVYCPFATLDEAGKSYLLINGDSNSIVGKGNHSVNHIQKIKPRVEQVCRELGLQYATEENAGRMYVDLTGGPAVMPPAHQYQQHQQQHQQQPQYSGGGGYPGQQQQQPQQYQQQQYNQYNQQGQQQQGKQDDIEQLVEKVLPRVFRKLGQCCVVM